MMFPRLFGNDRVTTTGFDGPSRGDPPDIVGNDHQPACGSDPLLRYRPLPERYRRSPKASLMDALTAEFSTYARTCAHSMNTHDRPWGGALKSQEGAWGASCAHAALVL
jgi:hypothetical protein